MLNISWFERFREFFDSLREEDRNRIESALLAIRERNFELLYIKEISGPIKEVRVGKHRVLFCIEYSNVYVFTGFLKKTMRTPRDQKETAQKLYSLLLQEINKK